MKTINIKGTIVPVAMPLNPEDKQPCWYAILNNRDNRSKAMWVVGVKEERGSKREYSFKLARAGEVDNKNFWQRATSQDFAIELINLFRAGRSKAVEGWVNNGCT